MSGKNPRFWGIDERRRRGIRRGTADSFGGRDEGGCVGERRQGQLLRDDAMHRLRPRGHLSIPDPAFGSILIRSMSSIAFYLSQIVALANLIPVDDSVDELDSYMYQTVSFLCLVFDNTRRRRLQCFDFQLFF